MSLKKIIEARRAYRALEPVHISQETIAQLSKAVQLAPSCFNNQPWRYVFVHDRQKLAEMHQALSKGNAWATRGSMIIAVTARKDADCIIKDRDFYYAFDTGMATAFLILQATELGLVAHPIAGFSPGKTRQILGIPDDVDVLALVIVGKKTADTGLLSEHQLEAEAKRPERLPVDRIVFHNSYQAEK